MILVAIASMLAAPVDTAASVPRAAFSDCLKQAVSGAKTANVATDAFDAYVRSQCAASEAALRKAVIAIDVKNGISRKDASENAQFELEDYFVSTTERYQAEVARSQPKAQQAEAQQAQAQQPQ